MPRATLVYLFNQKWQVLLWMKKRWFGINKRNGFGGKPKWPETPAETSVRELLEESWISVSADSLSQKGLLHFIFDDKPEWSQDVHVFRASYDGDFTETDEMLPQWRDIEKIPYQDAWEDDPFWMPLLIDNKDFEMTFHFNNDGKII